MRAHHIFAGLAFTAALLACATVEDKTPVAGPAPAKASDPMASAGRLVGGEWQVTFTSGFSAFHAWHWGPGRHSMRKLVHDRGVVDNPWAGEVMFWHPGRKEIRLLSVHGEIPGIGRGVAEGTIRFDGETAEGFSDLYQPGVRRKLGHRLAFDGFDKYHEVLLEATGPEGYKPLVEWDFIRVRERPAAPPSAVKEASRETSAVWKALQPLLGRTWKAKRESVAGDAFDIESTCTWIASLEVACVRVVAPAKEVGPVHLLDAYFYQHVGTNALRCLALSNRGGVYEGEATVLAGGALQLDLKGYEGDAVASSLMRLDFEQDGTLRQRVWFLEGAERTLRFDVSHRKSNMATPLRKVSPNSADRR